MRKLVWTQYALLDRDAIFDYIVSESPTAAVQVDAVRRLTEFPESVPRTHLLTIQFVFCAFCMEHRCGQMNLMMGKSDMPIVVASGLES